MEGPGCARSSGGRVVTPFIILGGLLAFGLLVYLAFALLRPEKF